MECTTEGQHMSEPRRSVPGRSGLLPRVLACVALFVVSVPAVADAPGDDEQVWQAFVSWLESHPESTKLQDYAGHLTESGVTEGEVERRLELIRKLFSEEPERGIELSFDRIFAKPLTGDPEQDVFTSTPSELMVEAVTDLEPGRVVDVGAGQGRNAVWLAQRGWDVTAIDVSGVGLAAARDNAAAAGTSIETVKTTYDAFDFGAGQWDLVLMILSWAPVSDPAFVARICESLRPGGVLVFEHVLVRPDDPFPEIVHALDPGQLRACFGDLTIDYYDESVRQGDWGGPPTAIVRMVASKPASPQGSSQL